MSAFSDLMAKCPDAWPGDWGFRQWLKSFYNYAASGGPPDWPVLQGVAPNSAAVGAPDTPITASGLNFISGAVLSVSGTDLATTFTSSTSLSATIPAAQLASAATLQITVRNPDSTTSLALPFTVS